MTVPSTPHPWMNHRPTGLNRRSALLGAAGLIGWTGLGSTLPGPAQAADSRLRLLGEQRLPHRLKFKDTVVGGLSGLDYDPTQDLWYALCDDRSDLNPARFYTLRLRVDAQGLGQPELVDAVLLRQPDGSVFPSKAQSAAAKGGAGPVADPESLRFAPRTRTLWWSSEGDRKLGLDPFIREMRLDGGHLRELSLPAHLCVQGASAQEGPRDNLGFEGLALSPDGHQLWAAMEGPLLQDGPVPTVDAAGGPCRITCFDTQSGAALRQIAYLPDAIPLKPIAPGLHADNGISEILADGPAHLLVLERSYSVGAGNSLRLYRIRHDEGSDTLAQAVLRPGAYRPVSKTLVANFSDTGLRRLDNTEGMAWGPSLPGHNADPARRTLVFVSDDNFNPSQITQFVAFEQRD